MRIYYVRRPSKAASAVEEELAVAGHEVVSYTGREFVARSRSNEPDVVIVEAVLDDKLLGHELAKSLLETDPTFGRRIIFAALNQNTRRYVKDLPVVPIINGGPGDFLRVVEQVKSPRRQ